jgi:hypothetical protein
MEYQIGQSKAIRNAIDKGCPAWLKAKAMERAKAAAAGSLGDSTDMRLQKLRKAFARYDVTPYHLEARVGREMKDFEEDDFAALLGVFNAIKDGQTTPENEFELKEPGSEG